VSITRAQTKFAPEPKGNYSQGILVGGLLFISGQLPLAPEGHLVGSTVAEQTKQALSNVKAILEAAGGTLSNLVQCTIYVSDITHWGEVDKVYGTFMSGVPVLPARAVVPVKEMHYGAQIEIQAIAAIAK
jgi:2-iminobutanoate/2-iminopropanoate deaminase